MGEGAGGGVASGRGVPSTHVWYDIGTSMQRRHYFLHQKMHSLEHTRARICKPFKEPRNRFPAWPAGSTTYLTYRPAGKHRLAESIPWNLSPGLLKRLQIRALILVVLLLATYTLPLLIELLCYCPLPRLVSFDWFTPVNHWTFVTYNEPEC